MSAKRKRSMRRWQAEHAATAEDVRARMALRLHQARTDLADLLRSTDQLRLASGRQMWKAYRLRRTLRDADLPVPPMTLWPR